MSPDVPHALPSTFLWYELHTPDAAAAQRFYSAVLGWGAQDAGMPDRAYTLVTVDAVPIAGLLQKPASSFTSTSTPAWLGYIGVSDIAATSKRLLETGGVIHRAAEVLPNVGTFSVVADPQGAVFVLFQPPAGIVAPTPPAPGTPGSASWHDLAAIDAEAAFRFYAGLFGWTADNAIDMGPAGTYQTFASRGALLGGMMNRMSPAQAPAWLFYFNVADLSSAVERATSLGGTLTHGPSPVPGGLVIAHCLDPQGALFGMVGPVH